MTYKEQSSDPPPDVIGINFAANVIKQNRQLILVLRETVTASTAARLIDDEKAQTYVKLFSFCALTYTHLR